MSTDALDQMPDAELSEVFAVEVAGLALHVRLNVWVDPSDKRSPCPRIRAFREVFATSSDAALPYAPVGLRIKRTANGWNTDLCTDFGGFMGDDEILARAVCKTILRAKRAEKGTG